MGAGLAADFDDRYRWDRNVFLLCVAMIWTGIGMGFGPQIVDHVVNDRPAYPPIVHVHAVAFVGWLVLLTVQVLLIRTHRVGVHRRLGVAGALLAALMLVLGPAAAFAVHALHFGKRGDDPAFLSVQLTDMLAFAGLVTAAIALRGRAAAHKRLMLLATFYISDAGFARWLAPGVIARFGDGFLATLAALYVGCDLLIVGLGAYDFGTRGRLHPAYLAGLAWALANQLTAVTLYFSPAWKPVALRLIGP